MRTKPEIEADIVSSVHRYYMDGCKTNRDRMFRYDKELTALNHAEADRKMKAAGE